ncbi:hypothetical protein SDC9_51692 [bioreactor metagenome]|uniref:Uncharacterized protein n=1 Tax=bioreactor metagenome TaxID=1076179 RepID=A0A644WNS7_9ZZZZ|nr:hypothetical protein [Clostridiales bacterium]
MAEEALLENQVTYLYHASAKKLYNLALSSIGDQLLAEQLAIDAFVFAYNRLSDKSDVTQFRIKSARHLYRKTKKTLIHHSRHSAQKLSTHESIESTNDTEKSRIQQLLSSLNYDERFLLLLLLQQKFAKKEIARVLYIPEFMVKKRIYHMFKKAISVWAGLSESFVPDKKPE